MKISKASFRSSSRPALQEFSHSAKTKPQDDFESSPSSALSWAPVELAELKKLAAPKPTSRALDFDHLFDRQEGWSGADGCYSLKMPDGSTLWLFSDTFWGPVKADGSRGDEVKFINNSIALQKPSGDISFHHGAGPSEDPETLFVPPDGRGWFWLHDAQVDSSGKVNVLLGQFDKSEKGGSFGFEGVGAWLGQMELTQDGPRVTSYKKVPHFRPNSPSGSSLFMGSSLMAEGEHLYIYGASDFGFERNSVLARVKSEELSDTTKWEFYDGKTWSSDSDDAAPIAPEVSVEYSVHKSAQGDYVMVTQKGLTPEIQVRRSPNPEGPWSKAETIWTAPEHTGSDITYNAKAHPELSDERGLLISYNVNSTDWDRNINIADIYRPRFIRVPDKTLV